MSRENTDALTARLVGRQLLSNNRKSPQPRFQAAACEEVWQTVAKITRKQLKEDRFAEEVGHSVEYVAHHRKQVILWAVGLVAAVLAVAGYFRYTHQQETEARHAFQEAMNLFHGQVETVEPQIGVVTFATNIEKNAKVTEAFEAISKNYPSRFEGAAAQYYLALHDIEQGRREEGQKRLESIVAGRNQEVASLARLALADLLQAEGKKDEARDMYQYLVDHPTDLVPAPRAQLALAKILIESDPQKAREMLESLQAMPGAISVTAVNLMSRLPVTE
jgi:predicted negative regulator of RcsB-dependent stress response